VNDDLERRLRDALRRTDLPAAPSGLRMRLDGLDQHPTGSTRGPSRIVWAVAVPVAAIMLFGLSGLIGGGPAPSVVPPTFQGSKSPPASSPVSGQAPIALGSEGSEHTGVDSDVAEPGAPFTWAVFIRNAADEPAIVDGYELLDKSPGLEVAAAAGMPNSPRAGVAIGVIMYATDELRAAINRWPLVGATIGPMAASGWESGGSLVFLLQVPSAGDYSLSAVRLRYHVGGQSFQTDLPSSLDVCAGAAVPPGSSCPFQAPIVSIDPGLAPRMTPYGVAHEVMNRIKAMEQMAGRVAAPPRIVSMTATSAAGISRLEPNAGSGQLPAGGIAWLVRAEGTFTTNRYPPGAEPPVATSGFYVLSDADGSVMSFGFP